MLERVTIGFGYTSYMYWMMKREDFLLAFDTEVKIALLTITVITGFTKPRKLGAALNCFISQTQSVVCRRAWLLKSTNETLSCAKQVDR